MRSLIAAINMSLDGICDHTALIGDEEIHQHYTDLLNSADTIIYGRITYQLMESYWPALVQNPTGIATSDDFANAIDKISKIVFSRTLKNVDWRTAELARGNLEEEVSKLKRQNGRDILVGSRSLVVSLLNLDLVDEFQVCVQPIIAGKGLLLLDKIDERIDLKLLKTKTLNKSGSIILYYKPVHR